jgi:hypothetical protein
MEQGGGDDGVSAAVPDLGLIGLEYNMSSV